MEKILFVSAETSGDIYSYKIVSELIKNYNRDFSVFVIGGDIFLDLKDKINWLYDSTNWSAIGPFNAYKKIPYLLKVFSKLKKIFLKERFNKVFLVDFPAFNMRFADFIKTEFSDTKIYYLIPPSTWKFDEKKIKNVCRLIDYIILPFPFNMEFYKNYCKKKIYYFGHPLSFLIQDFKLKYSKEDIYQQLNLDPDYNYIGIFPGSRKEEIDYIFPTLYNFMASFYKEYSHFRFLIPAANNFIFKILKNEYLTEDLDFVKLYLRQNYPIMYISKLNILTSGTVTLESLLFSKPMIVVYKMSYIHYILSKILKIGYIAIPNILKNDLLVPELRQQDLNLDNLYRCTKKFLFENNYDFNKEFDSLANQLKADVFFKEVIRLLLE